MQCRYDKHIHKQSILTRRKNINVADKQINKYTLLMLSEKNCFELARVTLEINPQLFLNNYKTKNKIIINPKFIHISKQIITNNQMKKGSKKRRQNGHRQANRN